jgi:adenylate kinase
LIVELIGCSGAGKTTLATALSVRSGVDHRIVTPMDLVTDRPGLRRVKNPHVLNVVADIRAFPHLLANLRCHRTFLRFAFDRLRWGAPSTLLKLNYVRSVVRRVGMHEMAVREGGDATVLADEGTLLIAYLLFVYSRAGFAQADLERFADLVPLPDRIVYVRVPPEVLLGRALGRPDPRRELAGAKPREAERWLHRATAVFDGLAAAPAVRRRLLIVDNSESTPDAKETLVNRIADFIGIGSVDQPTRDSSVSTGQAEMEEGRC